MAKSLRSKREKRLRAIRREIVEPFYDTKDAAKLAAQEAALAAPKLPQILHRIPPLLWLLIPIPVLIQSQLFLYSTVTP
ncbi:hypothetical protein CJ030_MR2G027122 [Morella rubra]|uniref:Uncharacterized protein n=1 Tax=Morella rubra TaxID=262757 RepID=A0A6A1W8P5_9ROSI|nr:hypothetical protein CJ030_MR2G027122 [Morella rubra]